jgi:hypothetical protein
MPRTKPANCTFQGRHHTPETIRKIREANLRIWGHRRGSHIPEWQRQLVKETTARGERHYEWKGQDAGYRAKHVWINREAGRASYCFNPNCLAPNSTRFQWANVSKEYRRDVNDYIPLCATCHKNWDMGKIEINITH